MDEEWEAMKMEAIAENIKYKEIDCKVCGEKTFYVQVDTIDGSRFQCEICGTYEGEDLNG